MFSPYHSFSNCGTLERAIENLRQSGTIPQSILEDYSRYHYALLHKLRCAHRYIAQLASILTNTRTDRAVTESQEFLFNVNMNIDGFFYTGGSALDILAREVITYFGITMPQRVYYEKAYDEISNNRPNDPLLTRLQDPPWKDEFSTYRNALTHELLIASYYSVNIDVDPVSQSTRIIVPLPDDPRMDPAIRTYIHNPDATIYCKTTFRRLVRLINTIYGDLAIRISGTHRLPI